MAKDTDPADWPEVIAPGALDSEVGKQVRLTAGGLGGPVIGTATVTGADESGVTLSIKTPAGTITGHLTAESA